MDGSGIAPVEFISLQNVTSDGRVTNIRVNAARALPSLDFGRVCICASGPSLGDHIEDIRERQAAGWHVAAMNGAYNFLQDHGIVADLFFMVDAREGKNLEFVSRPDRKTTFYIASQCHPEIFDAILNVYNPWDAYKVVVWHMFHDEAGVRAIKETLGERQAPCFVGGHNVGHSCLTAVWALGYKTWHLFGYDGSMRGDAKHAFAQPQNDSEEVQEFFWPMSDIGEHVPGVTKAYLATPTMAQAAQHFPEQVTKFRRMGITVEMFGEGLLPDLVAALASREGNVTVTTLPPTRSDVPPARPRARPMARLQVVCWKWKGHIAYGAEDVNIWARMVDRWLDMPSDLVCITDDPDGIDGSIRTIPLWRDQFEHGRDWHRIKIFSEEMADLIGPRFVSIDLDSVICGKLDPLFDHDAPFKAWRDPFRDQYCTSVFQMDAGAYPHVWEQFDPQLAKRLRQTGAFGGYDQAWISYVLPGQERWTSEDGVLSFRKDVLGGADLATRPVSATLGPPEGARLINFHGKYNPRDADVQEACPWIADHYQ